jgi:8-oxo-dGTP diphosphatase
MNELPAPDAEPPRPAVEVAVGVLFNAQGQFLLTTRPPGKVYSGYWEFAGGKVEPGESVAQALCRELKEELGIEVLHPQPWRTHEMDYPHARVRLNFCKVFQWQGELTMREGQQMAWQTLPVCVEPVLPGTWPVLEWLLAEAHQHPAQAPSTPTPSQTGTP